MKEQDEYLAEIKAIGKDAMALLRAAQDVDVSLASLPKTEANRIARAALLEKKQSLERQRYTLLRRQKDVAALRSRGIRDLRFGDAPSVTEALREIARRVGALEHLYVVLCDNLDDHAFDWRGSVAKHRRQLGDDPVQSSVATARDEIGGE